MTTNNKMVWIGNFWTEVVKRSIWEFAKGFVLCTAVGVGALFVAMPLMIWAIEGREAWPYIVKTFHDVEFYQAILLVPSGFALLVSGLGTFLNFIKTARSLRNEFREEFGEEPPSYGWNSRNPENHGPKVEAVYRTIRPLAQQLKNVLFPKENKIQAALREAKRIKDGGERRKSQMILHDELVAVRQEIAEVKSRFWRLHELAAAFECASSSGDNVIWDYATYR